MNQDFSQAENDDNISEHVNDIAEPQNDAIVIFLFFKT